MMNIMNTPHYTICHSSICFIALVYAMYGYLNCLSNSLFTGDNGSLYFWDWKTGYNFQKIQTQVQPGSLDSEAGIFATTFDQSGCRLITAEADKTIKIYKEDETAVSFVLCVHCVAIPFVLQGMLTFLVSALTTA